MTAASKPIPKPWLQLTGEDGNAFSVLGRARQAARKAGWSAEDIKAYLDDATSGDYNHLLAVTQEAFDVR